MENFPLNPLFATDNMKIKSITWISKEGEEAELRVLANAQSLKAFSHPCRYSEGDELKSPLNILQASNIIRSNSNEEVIEQGSEKYDSFINAKLIDQSISLCEALGFRFKIEDYIPADIKDGDYIQFRCERIDT